VEASLRCWPPADLLQQQLERQGGVGDVEAAEVPGQLLVDFTCGTQQVRPQWGMLSLNHREMHLAVLLQWRVAWSCHQSFLVLCTLNQFP
jgi:hypothetical protein